MDSIVLNENNKKDMDYLKEHFKKINGKTFDFNQTLDMLIKSYFKQSLQIEDLKIQVIGYKQQNKDLKKVIRESINKLDMKLQEYNPKEQDTCYFNHTLF